MSLQHKIDFAVIISVKNANPNGDPLNGNRPRTDYAGIGEISDVCLKRKIRDRLQDAGHAIFVQSAERKIDGMPSLKARAESEKHGLGKDAFKKGKQPEETARRACDTWLDVRAFGQLFAFSGGDSGGVSIPIRGPVSIHPAFSMAPVSITSTQITKSVSGEGDGTKRGSDTMGMKHRVDSAVYVTYGSISPQLAERTGFDDNDAAALKTVLTKLFEGDASSAPGQMAAWPWIRSSGGSMTARQGGTHPPVCIAVCMCSRTAALSWTSWRVWSRRLSRGFRQVVAPAWGATT